MENGHNPTQKAPPNLVKIEIILDQLTGAVSVNGPLGNPMFCYGMLEKARQAIQNFELEQAKQQRIVPATVLPLVRPA